MPGYEITVDDLRSLFTSPVGIGIAREMEATQSRLYPDELAILTPHARAVRRQQFQMGRLAARRALVDLSLPPVAIGTGSRGEPVWPGGIVGSITHTADVALAAAARDEYCGGIGLDAERLTRAFPERVRRLICLPSEGIWVAVSPETRLPMVFCAKEAVFKAVYPLARLELGFQDVELQWASGSDSFRVLLKRDYPVHKMDFVSLVGKCRSYGDLLIAVVQLPPIRLAASR
ncbi:MAG: 4'-phosphopantetheinyl transferase superfamily protein [Chloroflexi bacterium]|nr:MAG: 4'-phosphopantetheinyl transferase superfamily protein [Chloroflexota bacterium]